MTTSYGDIKLRPFQAEDVEALAPWPSALIGNDMGTGKTVEAVARDAYFRREYGMTGPTLVVSPLSVTPSWAHHFKTMTDLKVMRVNPKKRDESFREFERSGADVFLIHWDAVRLMEADLRFIGWGHIITDECHRAQNRETGWTKALKGIKTKYKTGLSGTLITGDPSKLWSILNWCYPKGPGEGSHEFDKYFTSYWRFYTKFVEFEEETITVGKKEDGTPILRKVKVIKGPKNEDLLHKLYHPYFVRHLKRGACCPHHPNGVTPELPDKTYTPMWVDLTPKQRRAFEAMKNDSLAWVGEHEDEALPAPVAVSRFTRLNQFCVAHATVDASGSVQLSEPSSKLDTVMDIILDNPNQQIVVYSQFAQLIRLLNARLKAKGVSYVSIMGDVPAALRGGMVAKFQSGEKRIFTGTIGAGGEGITLTAASTCIFTDRTWNPGMNRQAEDRLDRIGQRNPVNIIDIMATDTVDLGKDQKLEMKWDWIKRTLGDK